MPEIRGARTRRGLWPMLAVAVLLPGGTQGQRIDGILVDSRTGRGVPNAVLLLFDQGDQLRDSTTSNVDGQFVLSATAGGDFVISVQREGYASLLSNSVRVRDGRTVSYRMEVAPLSLANMEQMADAISRNQRLQRGLVDTCRGRMNPLAGGILVGVVRDSRSRDPLPGVEATLRVPVGEDVSPDSVLTAITDEHGTYLFCFAPAGDSVTVTVEDPEGRRDAQVVQIMPGTISWYDFRLRTGN